MTAQPALTEKPSFDFRPIALLLLVTLPWWLAVTCPFLVIDDPQYINPTVLSGLNARSITWAFTATAPSYWQPLTWLSLMLDATLFGPGPDGFHFTNVLLHIINTLLVYLLLHRLTGSIGRSLAVAAFFSLHPLRVESVAWATERKDVLSAFFGLLALIAYARYATVRSSAFRRWFPYSLSLLLFALSLMTKPMLVTLPVLLLLLDYWPLNRLTNSHAPQSPDHSREPLFRISDFGFRFSVLLEKLPFALLAAASAFVTSHIVGARTDVPSFPLLLRLENAIVALALTLRDNFLPANRSIFYPMPSSIPIWQVAIALTVLLIVAALIALAVKQKRTFAAPLLVGALWFLIALFPVLNLVQSGEQSRADRFSYIPSIGLCIAVVWTYATFSQRFRRSPLKLAAAVIILLAVQTFLRIELFRDPIRLYETSLLNTDNNYQLESWTAAAYEQRHEPQQAIQHYERSLALRPPGTGALEHNNIGSLLAQSGDLEGALPHFEKAHQLAPKDQNFDANYRRVLAELEQKRSNRPSFTP